MTGKGQERNRAGGEINSLGKESTSLLSGSVAGVWSASRDGRFDGALTPRVQGYRPDLSPQPTFKTAPTIDRVGW